jgi:hypothetical protein
MHDVKLVLFAIPSPLSAFARSATPRDRRTRKDHERLRLKLRPEKEELCLPREPGCIALCMAKDDGHGGSEDVQ